MSNRVLSVANHFIELAKREGQPISNMKLQKLLFFAHGHNLGLRGVRLVDEVPEAWDYGPVFPSIYHAFKAYGSQPITSPGACFVWNSDGTVIQVPAPPISDPADIQMIEAVWNSYKNYSPIQLSNMSHVPAGPWEQARKLGYKNADIADETVKAYFQPNITA